MKVAVLGAGAYGLALASIFNKNNHEVEIWTNNESEKNLLLEFNSIDFNLINDN